MVKVTRESPITGSMVSMFIPTTQEKVDQWIKWNRSEGTPLVHEYFPELTKGQREFLLTGIPPNEWEEIFPDTEEDR